MLKEEPAQRLGFREHIFGGLTSMTHALVMVANIHSLWLSFGNSLHARVIRNTYKYGQPEIIRGIIGTEDGSTLTVGRTARSTTDCSNDSVNVLMRQWRDRTLFRRRHHPRI